MLVIPVKLFLLSLLLQNICSSQLENESCTKDDKVIKCDKKDKSIYLRDTALAGNSENVLVFTVASEPVEGYVRYIRSATFYGIDVQTLGMGEKWQGGDMKSTGGGYKVNLLRKALEPYKKDKEKIVIFTDSYDVIFTAPIGVILSKFNKMDARIVFGAEHSIWPDASLRELYPKVSHGARFLNSGAFMGYASDLYDMLSTPLDNTDDDQLYYTKIFLNEEFREKHKMKLDNRAEIFQNLFGAEKDVELHFDTESGEAFVGNVDTETVPTIIHGNGLSKQRLNSLGNYLAGAFMNGECKDCTENLKELNEKELPVVSMAVFIEKAMPFFREFLEHLENIDYPKNKIDIFLHNNVKYHEEEITKFITKQSNNFKSVKQILVEDSINEGTARNLAIQQAILKESDYLFVVDSEAHIDDPKTLRKLITKNRDVIAPMITRPNDAWSNFWGALSEQGYYARSHDYLDIVNNKKRGIWNVPYISSCYLVKKKVLKKLSYVHESYDPDMAMCHHLRTNNIFMHVDNLEDYGHLVNGDQFNVRNTRPDFYMLLSNQRDWERRYIHPDYAKHLEPNANRTQPCPDVYWFPIATEEFCNDLVAIMENFGRWSDGSNQDKRLEGGYEAVPTRDIHMNQVGLEKMWLKFLHLYVRPLQEAVFIGYFHDPPKSLMNFVVRYRPDEQPFLRPHHDSSTYTINIALNRVGIDYTGGGCRFLRYNCSVEATKMGWMLMHPGRLTHFHEGLRTTSGTRYIMISFVDP
ncbi:procollagen-lysine,2-oxoglutarate 5-dioxygenase isoform X1 [Lutzomyia longipalpis]|uniref:procollagen-lysine,2-oxoglutarate 5-dioxygenase isoform X1 n=1 Tax=Lutzomyia longipalpis TaxID=7200 RepID=UPI002483C671|nr:procollagen-lysine,2-oxoglutarate 5-dioxygenase isoform X1 [Lutzomyia longipalpis]XP_055696090.1 procollagen-lysine,2-oxoglutarate 5-dioxygenase isoform X1 [Lutzomyia longipalpis]